jgi:dienelactone hydrolase
MQIATTSLAVVMLLGSAAAVPARAQTAGAPVALKAADGTSLKATYFTAGKPGPGLVLLHQCNQDRTSWTRFATSAAARGYHVLTLDYRGFGESGGVRAQTPADEHGSKWPGDVDAAFSYLTSQPGVDTQRIGAAGASCGVNQAAQLARRHPEVKTLVMLSGAVEPGAREYLRQSSWLPILAAASLDDGNAVATMRWTLGWSHHPASKFVEFKAAGHGTEMFTAEPGLEPAMLDWFEGHLRHASTMAPASSSPARRPAEEFWFVLTQPDGVTKARQIYDAAKKKDRATVLFPEEELNQYGYQLLQQGRTKDAIVAFQMNVDEYPESPNTYDSLSDAYLADGNASEALSYAERAIQKLSTDTVTPPEFKQAIRESAEKKISALKKKAP